MTSDAAVTRRWQARPIEAAAIRAVTFLAPIAASIVAVRLVSRVVPIPTGSFALFIGWWGLLSAGGTVVLIMVERVSRRLLPLAALFKLSLVFPDRAPSRFKTALKAGTVDSLEERVTAARQGAERATPVEEAERLLRLVAQLDTHDRLTRGHSERVRAYAQMIGEELRLSRHELDLLNWAALLHDVGKLDLPTEILTKSGRPTDEEWEVIRRHPELGESRVAPLRSWLGEWTDAVAQHHERWDGAGYPHGRSGEEIALAGRIVAVADVFDVITSARSYKAAGAAVEGRDEIARCAGAQFDPRVVRAFLGVSLGRLRLAMGPLSWLAHAPVLGRLPLTPAVGSLTGSLAAVAAATASGLVGGATPSPPELAVRTPEPVAAPAPAAPVARPVGLSRPAEPKPRASRATAPPVAPPAPSGPPTAPSVEVTIDEDTMALVPLEGVSGDPRLAALVVTDPPEQGRADVTPVAELLYRPAPDTSGVAQIGYRACWAGGDCGAGIVRVVVRPVNDPPVARPDTAVTDEDTPVAIVVLSNDADVDGDLLAVEEVSAPGGGEAGREGNVLVYRPPPDFSGRATLAYTARDGQGGRSAASVVVDVQPVNDPPVAVADRATVREGGTTTIDVLANDTDPDGGVLEAVSVGTPGSGAVALGAGRISYSAPPAFAGSDSFSYRVADGAGGTARGTVSVTVEGINTAPSFTAGPDVVVNENSGPHAIARWAPAASPGSADEEGQTVSFLVATDNRALFAPGSPPAVAPDGTLTFSPARNANGSATITVRAVDDGGTANGGADTSEPQTFTIAVLPVNSRPSFAAGPDQSVAEDAGPQTVAGWATQIAPGPPDEADQAMSFIVTANAPGLFAAGGRPAVTGDGALTFTPAANASGTATVTVEAVDDGGTANGGADRSAPQTFAITTTPLDDAPTAVDDAVSVDEDAPGGITFSVLANDSDIDAGDVVTLASFDGSTIANGVLTWGGGSFTYVPAAGYSGSETFAYAVADGSGAMDGGVVTITVVPQPDAPEAADDGYATQVGVALVEPAPGVLANDADEDLDALTVQTAPVTGPSNGTLTLSADGSFTYVPSAGWVGTDTFTYRVDDGTGRTADAVAFITVGAVVASSTLYLQPSGSSGDAWDLGLLPPPAASPVPDHDGDGDPGLTIDDSGGSENNPDTAKRQEWVYTTPAPLVLNGPVTLQLWSALSGFWLNRSGHPYMYLYDCAPGGVGCTKIAENDVHVERWSSLFSTWVFREFTVGSPSTTIAAGRELRLRLLFRHADLWLAMTAARPSALVLSLG